MKRQSTNREVPILFSQQFIPKLLDGTKTETRRPIKPQPPSDIDQLHGNDLRGRAPYDIEHPETGQVIGFGFQDDNDVIYKVPCKVGDVIWVRETWRFFGRDRGHGPEGGFEYRSNLVQRMFEDFANSDIAWESFAKTYGTGDCNKWKPSIHMPRWAARIFLEVTEVRVERVWKIDEPSVLAEGIGEEHLRKNRPFFHKDDVAGVTFREFWDECYPKTPWSQNPWVSVTKFKLLKDYKGAAK